MKLFLNTAYWVLIPVYLCFVIFPIFENLELTQMQELVTGFFLGLFYFSAFKSLEVAFDG